MADYRSFDNDSDYRNLNTEYRNPDDPMRDRRYDRNGGTASTMWGWIAGAVFLAVIIAVALGIGHEPGRSGMNTASNDTLPPAGSRMAPPPTFAPTPPSATPAPPEAMPAPISPAPGTPAQRSSAQP